MSQRTLTAAIDSNDLAALESLLAAGADPDAGPRSALVAALENERLDRGVWVERLLERGADPNRLSDDTWPLTVAIEQGLTGVALRLLERGASANVREGASPLRAALKARDAELVKALLARGADPRAPDPASDKLPLALAIEHEQFEIAELLLDEGADPRDANEYSSPLGAAIAVGSIVWVERLLRLGADAAHRDYNRLGLLAGAASRSRSPEMLCALYRLGFGTAEAHVEALWAAAVFRDDAAVVATLLELGGVPSQGDLLHATNTAVVNVVAGQRHAGGRAEHAARSGGPRLRSRPGRAPPAGGRRSDGPSRPPRVGTSPRASSPSVRSTSRPSLARWATGPPARCASRSTKRGCRVPRRSARSDLPRGAAARGPGDRRARARRPRG